MHWMRRAAAAAGGPTGPFTAGEIASMVANNALAAMWDTGVLASVALNGNDLSGITDLTGAGINVAQGASANQPLYNGAPIFGTWQFAQFTGANNDRLIRANTSIITNANNGTLVWVAALTAGGTQFQFSHLNEATAADGITLSTVAATNRNIQTPRAGGSALNHGSSISNPVTGVPDVFIWTVNGTNSIFYINGNVVANTNSSNPLVVPTSGTDTLTIGALVNGGAGAESFSWGFGAWFNSGISPALAGTISSRLKGRLGI